MLTLLRNLTIHPAIPLLLESQRVAIIRKLKRSFASKRRFALSCLAVVLAIAWLGNAILSILYREPLNPDRFRGSLATGLLTYTLWHLVRAAFKRPEVGIEWTPAEIEQLVGGPFQRKDLLAYRFTAIVNAAFVKAVCFSVLMLPDLSIWFAGMLGAFLGLLFVDLWRMSVELVAWGISDKAYAYLRYGMAAIVGAFVTSTLIIAFSTPLAWHKLSTPASIGMMGHLLSSAATLRETIVGQICMAPFELFANMITTTSFSTLFWISFAVAATIVLSMFWLVMRMDDRLNRYAKEKERKSYDALKRQSKLDSVLQKTPLKLPRIPWQFGLGPLAWRQAHGAFHYRSSLLFCLLVPGILAGLPILVYRNPYHILLNVLGALVFYSFLLLPTALKFDFRRDLDRIVILKSLPLPPLVIVLGQMFTPVAVATLYQVIVLAIVACLRPLPMELVGVSILLLIPLNFLIFAVENVFFLLYPYRVNQEGFAVFLRTTLTFTAKGILFFIALTIIVAWALSADKATTLLNHAMGISLDHRVLFGIGLWFFVVGCSLMALKYLTRIFVRFDLTQDIPH